jgi:porin
MPPSSTLRFLIAVVPAGACTDYSPERLRVLPRPPTADLTYTADRAHEPGRGRIRCVVRDDNGDLRHVTLNGPAVDLRGPVVGRVDTVTVAVDSLPAGRRGWTCTVRDAGGHTAVARTETAVDANRPPPSRLRVSRRDGVWRLTLLPVTDPDGDSVSYAVRISGPTVRSIGPLMVPIDTTLVLPPGRYSVLGVASDGVAADSVRYAVASGPAPAITHVADRRGTALVYTSTVTADHAVLTVVRAPADTLYRGPVPADSIFAGATPGDTLGLLKGVYRFTIEAERNAWGGRAAVEVTIPNLDPSVDLRAVDATVPAGSRVMLPLPPPTDPNREDRPAYESAVALDGKVGVVLEGPALAVRADTDAAGPYRIALTIGDSTTGVAVWELAGVIVSQAASRDTAASKSGYDDVRIAGGANSVEADLVSDDRTKRPLLDIDLLERPLKGYYRFKRRLHEAIGLAVSADYAVLNQFATYSASDRQAASGVFRVYGSWGAFPSGRLVLKVENRHRIGPGLTPRNLGFEAGSSLSTVGFKEFGWGVTALYWNQRLGDRFGVVVGRMDPGDFADVYPLLTAWKAFMNDAFANNPAVALPLQGLGIAAAVGLRGPWYVAAGLHDANGSPTDPGLTTFFDVREYYTWVETGWSPGREIMSGVGVHVNAWRQDARTAAATPESWGVTTSASREIGGRWTPFLRAGYSEGGAAQVRFMIGGGVGLTMRRGGDYLAVATSWSAPPDRALRGQVTTEALYRLQLTENLAVTPDLQLTLFPSATLERDVIAVVGVLRLRLAL